LNEVRSGGGRGVVGGGIVGGGVVGGGFVGGVVVGGGVVAGGPDTKPEEEDPPQALREKMTPMNMAPPTRR